MPSWKAICQDSIPSYNTGNTEVQNIGVSLAGEKEKREGGKSGKEQPEQKLLSFCPGNDLLIQK